MFTILTLLSMIIFFAITTPLMIILLIVRLFAPKFAARVGQPVASFLMRAFMLCGGVTKKVKGKENIPRDRKVLFVANHRGIYDVMITFTTIPVTYLTSFVAKKELEKVPFLAWWMKIFNCAFIDRENIREGVKSIKKAIEDIERGWSVFIMPEGTRNKGEGVLEFKGGSFKIAERTGIPVIPVAITHTDEVFEKHKPFIKPTKLGIQFGKPIETAGLSRDELREIPEKARAEVVRMYEEMLRADGTIK